MEILGVMDLDDLDVEGLDVEDLDVVGLPVVGIALVENALKRCQDWGVCLAIRLVWLTSLSPVSWPGGPGASTDTIRISCKCVFDIAISLTWNITSSHLADLGHDTGWLQENTSEADVNTKIPAR
ncbi:MAG: hypothetical protein Q9164_002807 [Protoblastenia rupestris]